MPVVALDSQTLCLLTTFHLCPVQWADLWMPKRTWWQPWPGAQQHVVPRTVPNFISKEVLDSAFQGSSLGAGATMLGRSVQL